MKLKYMLPATDGEVLWASPRDGWQVKWPRHRFAHSMAAIEYHDVTTPLANIGRATCRVCGQPIPRGRPRFVLVADVNDNLWAAVKFHVHGERCV